MIETLNETRARLFAGGTYFVSREVGVRANDIAVQITAGPTNTLTVSKKQSGSSIIYSGSGKGDISTVVFFDDQPDIYTVMTDDGRNFSVMAGESEIGIAKAGKVFRSSRIGFLIQSKDHVNGDTFTISTGKVETFTASSISAMRILVNQTSDLIKMPAAGQDVNNVAVDATNFSTIPATNLSGGSGLPIFPPTNLPIPMAFVNYREAEDGSLDVVAKVYQWEGNAGSGKWITTDTSVPTPNSV